jgi:O-antigen/teichoic acid export membrane protein/CelD/BcsL family acetyltransferase involved in cellulose biosynthesis
VSATDSLETQRRADAQNEPAPARPAANESEDHAALRRHSASASDIAGNAPRRWTNKIIDVVRAWLIDPSHDSLAQRVASMAFAIRIASALLAYISQIALARWMGAHEFGVFVYVWTWTLLIGGFADAGLAAAAQKFIPEYAGRQAFDHLRGFIVASRGLAATTATVLALLAVVAVKLGAPLLDQSAIIPLYIACLCLPIYALCSVQDGIARCYNSIGVGLVPTFIVRPVLLLTLMAIAHFSGFGSDATVAIICSVASFWLIGMVQTLLLQRSLATSVPLGARAYELTAWMGMSLPIVMVIGFYVLLTYVDIIILQQYRPPEDVALYHAATKTLTLVTFVYFSVSAATAHRFAEYQTAGNHARLQSFVAKATNWTFWPSVAVAALVLAFGQLLLMLFGRDFVAAYPLMFILAIGLLARASIGPCERLLIMVGQQRACAAAYGAAFVTNLIACMLLVPYFGGMGAAVSTSFALMVESLLLFGIVRRRLGLYSFVIPRAEPTTNSLKELDGVVAVDAASIVPAQAGGEFEIEWRAPADLADISDEWRALCKRAIEPNVFFEPAYLRNAAPRFGKNVVVALIWSTATMPRRLVGLLPVRNVLRSGFTPMLVGFTHPFSALSMPLIDAELAIPAVGALLDHISGDAGLPKTLVIPFVAANGAFAAAVQAVMAQRSARFAAFDRHSRALYAPAGERDGYVTRALSGKKRKELRRQRSRLEDSGALTFSLSNPPETPAALQEFLALEAAGWKGKRGTAVQCDRATREFFIKAVSGLAAENQATIARLRQAGRLIAAGVVIKSGKGAWFLKIAYDEALAQYSPGVQLTLDLTEALARDPDIAFIDSCAIADHPMIDHLWRERLQVADWMIGLNPRRPFALDCQVERLRRQVRSVLKWFYYKIR